MDAITFVLIILAIVIIITIFRTARIVPNQWVFIIERLGKYSRTLEAGFHILFPFIDKVAYKHSLKEFAIDVPPQTCITKDNITVEIDGVLYMRVVDPIKASYGIRDYRFAITQLSQTTMRSEIGKLDLDVTFESRENINASIVSAVDEASDPWGIKVTRYEIKNIEPPQTIRDAMEKQMRAEREKREAIALSEGDRQAKINRAEGDKQEAVKKSEGERVKRENEAKGKAYAILEVARATAEGIRQISMAIKEPGGKEAVSMQIAQDWIQSFESLAKTTNSMIVPTNVADMASVTGILAKAFDFAKEKKL
ncbi:MAG: paraslipin [Candidatus Aminicenantes bacterium]|nr:paraslipin [Candidatus Aminicenantes bacterium]NIM78938.1 paraslipin [Candidatus Aminicenantes bacterium]NIN18198.1 paraslipin [Candidatus Aminicenantes bacterium]NIN42097.1 paraslipin [Candidatus Aminicenantes bacterium]NIN84850.1 paraslipin [Candidatus Aminicenantes bacterium]